MIDSSVQIINSEIIPPCFIGANSKIENCTIGPYVSIGEETSIKDSEIKNTIIQTQSHLFNAKLSNSMVGNLVQFNGHNINQEISIGDYCEIK